MLDYVEELYWDWNDGARTSGPAAQRVNAEFQRIRRELGDLPGAVADQARLRTLLRHLTTTLHPGAHSTQTPRSASNAPSSPDGPYRSTTCA
jgi:hypothetical protein